MSTFCCRTFGGHCRYLFYDTVCSTISNLFVDDVTYIDNSLLFKSRIRHQIWKKAFLYLNDKPFAIDKILLYWTQQLYENYTYSISLLQISTLLKLQYRITN